MKASGVGGGTGGCCQGAEASDWSKRDPSGRVIGMRIIHLKSDTPQTPGPPQAVADPDPPGVGTSPGLIPAVETT